MKERPIIFSSDMVRAILDGRKTMTRRIVMPQPRTKADIGYYGIGTPFIRPIDPRRPHYLARPYGYPGDRLWVRETTINVEDHGYVGPVYVASDEGAECLQWGLRPDPDDMTDVELKLRPSIHMPRSMSRITLKITGVRVERLQDISEDDALAEGIREPKFHDWRREAWWKDEFARLWDSLHGKGSWDANHWVWVIEFRRLKP